MNQVRLQALLSYNPQTGLFYWNPRRGCQTSKPVGCDNGYGYLRIIVDGKTYYAHRLAWFYMTGEWPEHEIDHINGDRADNRIANLRPATPTENQHNRNKPPRNNKSGAVGVSWHQRAGKWQAHFARRYLGVFPTKEAAASAYTQAKEGA
jgi:hypothetical protein